MSLDQQSNSILPIQNQLNLNFGMICASYLKLEHISSAQSYQKLNWTDQNIDLKPCSFGSSFFVGVGFKNFKMVY